MIQERKIMTALYKQAIVISYWQKGPVSVNGEKNKRKT